MADPGFPIGGVDLRHGHFLVKMYVKMKELGPIGGHALGMPPRSANAKYFKTCKLIFPMAFLLKIGISHLADYCRNRDGLPSSINACWEVHV